MELEVVEEEEQKDDELKDTEEEVVEVQCHFNWLVQCASPLFAPLPW